MNQFIKTDPWLLVEERFDPARVKSSESLFALGNGVMGGRANFEEPYSGESLQGNYIGAIYYPDKTRVGWWKNGYPEYFAKVLNSAFWIGVGVEVDGEPLDLARVEVLAFRRELDMRRSVLTRRMTVRMPSGVEVEAEIVRFLSLQRRELGVSRYAVRPLNKAAEITFAPFIDADVRNTDANYDEKFWEPVATDGDAVQSRTKKSGFDVAWAQRVVLAGDPRYTVTGGSATFHGVDLLSLAPENRSHEGLFLSFQYPVEIPGVSTVNFMRAAINAKRAYLHETPLSAGDFLKLMRQKRAIVELDNKLASRSVNEGFSGGEKKRNEIFQMAMLEPRLSILDETDSGLDIDALRIVAGGVNKLKTTQNATIVITHYQRLLDYIRPDFVHILYKGRIVHSGGPDLALELEEKGYDWIKQQVDNE